MVVSPPDAFSLFDKCSETFHDIIPYGDSNFILCALLYML